MLLVLERTINSKSRERPTTELVSDTNKNSFFVIQLEVPNERVGLNLTDQIGLN